MTTTGASPQLLAEPRAQRVTALELFFDLVFVFAITQITGFITANPTWLRLLEGMAILAALWWAWTGYAWLANTAASDEGAMRVVLLAVTAPLLVVALAVPGAFGGDGLTFGVALLAVRILHLVGYAIVSHDDPQLRRVVVRLATTILPAAGLLVLAGALDGPARAACWAVALVLDYGGLAVRGITGWRIEPYHFAERHALIIIIALGESIVSLGVGAGALHVGARTIAAALLGITIAAALWWAYFDVVALAGEQRMRQAEGDEQALIARDSYSYLHLPMVAGIILFAVGVKDALSQRTAGLSVVTAASLCGGVALYLLALSAFKRRNYRSFNRPRLVAAVALLALVPAAIAVTPLLALGMVAVVACCLIAFEVIRYAQARDRIRHA